MNMILMVILLESQAFAYLAIRSFLKLPISFPNTTGCKKPVTGGNNSKKFLINKELFLFLYIYPNF